MILKQLDVELLKYDEAFSEFRRRHQLPEEWFAQPDHFAIKCADEADYLATCEELRSEVTPDGIWQISLDERFLASAQLLGETTLGSYGFKWVEIMQPRPGKELTSGFVEHTEFVFPNFDQVLTVLKGSDAEIEIQKNPGHSWVNVVIDPAGREIKFNDKSLEDVAEHEKSHGLLTRLM